MIKFKMLFVFLPVGAMFFVSFPSHAQSLSSQETLNQYVADLQKNPDDQALRENIIKLVVTINPKPITPQGAVMHEGAAEFAIKHAKTAADFADAAKEYEQALLSAPWSAQDYFNCGVAYEKAEQYDAAVKNFNLYLVAAPGAKDTNDVLKRIGGLEYAANKAAKESSPEAVAAKQETDYAQWLKNLDGARYTGPYIVSDQQYEDELTVRGAIMNWRQRVTVYGQNAVQEVPVGQWYDMAQWGGGQMQIVGREAKRSLEGIGVVDTFTISKDGKSIAHVTGGKTFTCYRQ